MAPDQIRDRFARIPDHRERYRLRRKAEGRCIACGMKREGASRLYCDAHLEMHLIRCAAYREKRRALKESLKLAQDAAGKLTAKS